MSITRMCPTCDTEFMVKFKSIRKRFCSKSCGKKSQLNPQWKGRNVQINGLHKRIENQKGRPDCCENCGKVGRVDLANISGEYKFDLVDWEWLCRKCHMEKDGRLAIFLSHSNMHKKLADKNCKYCGKDFHPWNKTVNFCSLSCSTTYNNIKRGKGKNKLKLTCAI